MQEIKTNHIVLYLANGVWSQAIREETKLGQTTQKRVVHKGQTTPERIVHKKLDKPGQRPLRWSQRTPVGS